MCRHRTIRHRSSWPSQEAESSPNTCLPKRKRLSSRRPLSVSACLCISLSNLCLSPCAMSICMSICMCHVYLHAPCVSLCHVYVHAPCVCASVCACGMCFTAPSLCQHEASLSAHDTNVASAFEGEMASHEMSATCQLMRCLLMPSKVRWLLIKMPPYQMAPHQDGSSSDGSSCLGGTLNHRPPQTLNLRTLSAQPFFGLEK